MDQNPTKTTQFPPAPQASHIRPHTLPQCYRMINLRHLRTVLGVFLLFWRFLSPKPANQENYGFWKSEKPPNRQYGGFSAIFVQFLQVFKRFFIILMIFTCQNRLIWKLMDFENLKNCQTAIMAVFWRFLCGFCRFLSSFSLF